jgi:hypothetical protein
VRHERWDGIYGVLGSDGREWGRTVIVNDWALLEGEGRYLHRLHHGCSAYTSGESLPPPRAEDRFLLWGKPKVVIGALGFVPEPEVPEPYRRRAEVQEVSHRVWQDYGTDGTRTWPRWWCSCGAHGQGWPANHGDSR